MPSLSFKITEELRMRMDRAAAQLGITRSELHRRAMESYLAGLGSADGEAIGIQDLIGSVEGPRDLSTNSLHLEDFGQ